MLMRPKWRPQGVAAKVASLPAPVGGWNARDSLANMDPLDAYSLVNMFPGTTNVVLRGGSSSWATGMSGQVQTLMTYSGGSTAQMFAIDSGGKSIYNVTTQGAVGAPVVTGLTNAIWEYANITTSGGNYLVCVNGVDKLELYDGTTWKAIDSGSTPAITNVATTALNNVVLFKSRLWFIQKNTLKAWYLPTASIAGAASEFDLTSVARLGGYIVDVGTWTIDAGYGVDDNLAFITNKGEIIVYSGTDPANAATFGLIGIWQLGSPVGTRCMLKYGGDLLIITLDGLLPLASALQSSRLDPRVALSDKIQGAISAATSAYGGNHAAVGWEIFYFPKENALWVNVPVAEGQQQQYVMNTITKNWCQFTGWPANCWALFNDSPYFGGNGTVYVAWDGTYADLGNNINGTAFQAFNYFGSRGTKKYFTRAHTGIFTNGSPTISVGVNVDFNVTDTLAPITYSASGAATWGNGVWGVSLWGSSLVIQNAWNGITGLGYCASVQLKSASKGLQIKWASTDVVYQQGWAGI